MTSIHTPAHVQEIAEALAGLRQCYADLNEWASDRLHVALDTLDATFGRDGLPDALVTWDVSWRDRLRAHGQLFQRFGVRWIESRRDRSEPDRPPTGRSRTSRRPAPLVEQLASIHSFDDRAPVLERDEIGAPSRPAVTPASRNAESDGRRALR